MTLGWRWSLVYKIYRSKVEFPFPVSLTLSYSQHQSHISFGIDQITLSEAQCQQFGFALVGPLPPAAAKPPQKFSFKKLFAAKIKASEISQGDETAPVSTSASWGSDCSLKLRICNAHAAKEDLLRIKSLLICPVSNMDGGCSSLLFQWRAHHCSSRYHQNGSVQRCLTLM